MIFIIKMILLWKYIANNFIIEMYSKWFYNENKLQMIFIIKMYYEWFYNENALQMIFCHKNVLEIILL